jgi:ribosomal protein S18 acetylase RimI-like enzyme
MMERHQSLDNAVWWSLTTHHRRHAEIHGRAGRYHHDVSPFAAMAGFDEESWGDLAHLIGHAYFCVLFCADIPSDLPTGWTLRERGEGRQMVVDRGRLKAAEPIASRLLTPDDVPQMLELVEITRPGPFQPGTVELGRYYGHFQGERLVAMAGERLHLSGFTEISAVCTHPDVQGQGLASALTHHVASVILGEGRQPFLHVAASNERARRVYEDLGFRQRRLVDFALLESPPH